MDCLLCCSLLTNSKKKWLDLLFKALGILSYGRKAALTVADSCKCRQNIVEAYQLQRYEVIKDVSCIILKQDSLNSCKLLRQGMHCTPLLVF
jgi:hypothetical protein